MNKHIILRWLLASAGVFATNGALAQSCNQTTQNQPCYLNTNLLNNIALGKTVVVSSYEGAGYEAGKGVDGNSSSRWASALNASSASYTLDLGGHYDINGLSLHWEAAYATGYNIQMSSDGINFSNPIFSTSSGRGGQESITSTGQGRYLRINMTNKANPAWGYSLWEIQVYGSLFSGGSSSVTTSTSSSAISSSTLSSQASTGGSNLSCSLRQTGSWNGGYQLEVQVSNQGPAVNSWTVYLDYTQAAQITGSWNASLSGNNTTRISASNIGYNGNLARGASTSFGLTGNSGSGFVLPLCRTQGIGISSTSSNSSSASSLSSTSATSQSSSTHSSQGSSVPAGNYQAVATHFESFGIPYGGCGIPQDRLETQHFVALNAFHSPGNYTHWPRPLSGANLAYLGEFNNGKNCGRWVRVSIEEDCNGLNDGAQNQTFCRNGNWVKDGKEGATLDMLVADSCGDDNAWCRDSRYHLDLATASVTNQFSLNGAPVTLLPGSFNNRKISWRYIEAPDYQGDIRIYFMQGAENYWPAIAINHLKNGIHAVEQLVNGTWVKVPMNSDMGQSYLLQGGASQFQIRVYDVNDQLINGGRIYSFSFPSSCGSKCSAPLTQVIYSIQ